MKYESSQYLIYSNPINHSCPKAKLIWHHGEIKFEKINSKNENRYKIILNSIKNDGRQLISEPCLNAFAEYTRYNTPQEIWKLNLEWDNYLKNWKLILYNDEPIEFKNNIVDDEFGFYNLGLKKIVMWLDNDSDDVSSNMLPSKFKNKKKIFVDV
ncbi:rot1 [Candida pseudojiufengensis]|uniref:rot1 n=1 Tax=Candida pseudojiufengensis TaxID=497109 RepID=UPI0022256A26|nr:rot1 [Candida pseudojiufengensis]KAI5965678.1 rot1 [Candida pseudojiufengensis]